MSLALSACDGVGVGSDSDSDIIETVQSTLMIGPAGHALGYLPCATEGGTCSTTVGEQKYLAYGANGSYLFAKSSTTGSTLCNPTTFGGNPAPGVSKACYLAFHSYRCAEGTSSCYVGMTRDVAYGANGVFNFARLGGLFACNNATFGDPVPGTVKDCYVALDAYDLVVTEGGTLVGLNNRAVAYGANGNFVFRIGNGSMPCTDAAFGGGDPVPGVQKGCYTVGYPFAADEYGSFTPGGQGFVYYGSGLNGNFLLKNLSGTVSCSNTTFGGDPHVGASKRCYAMP
jgi:hypothetical protein